MESSIPILIAIAAITGAIIVLAVFFTLLGRVKDRLRHDITVPKSSFMEAGARVTVRMRDGTRLENARFVGFTRNIPYESEMPHELSKMMVFETEDGKRVYILPNKVSQLEQLDLPRSFTKT